MRKRKILFVDDEEVILFGYTRFLAKPWVGIYPAQTLKEALVLIETNEFDAAVVDLRLSNSVDIQGLEIISVLKQKHSKCLIIVLTALGEEHLKQSALDLGADMFLQKPVNPQSIQYILSSMNIS